MNIYRTGMYLRLSREDEDLGMDDGETSSSICNQELLIREYLRTRPELQLRACWIDDGCSGLTFERPGFQTMLKDLSEHKIDCIIVKDLSRFGRNYIEAGSYIERLFPLWGIRFIAVNDGYDSLDPAAFSGLMVPFKNLINEAYCQDLSRKVRSHLDVRRRLGYFTGAFAPYGYQKDPQNKNHLIPDPAAAPIVRYIFAARLQGFPLSEIAAFLNNRGIPSPYRQKQTGTPSYQTSFSADADTSWYPQSVKRILLDPVYTGLLVQKKRSRPNYKSLQVSSSACSPICFPNAHEPLISSVEYRLTQIQLARSTRCAPGESKLSPLSGLLFCGRCRSPMIRKGGRSKSFLVCRNKNMAGNCSWNRTSESELTELLVHALTYAAGEYSGLLSVSFLTDHLWLLPLLIHHSLVGPGKEISLYLNFCLSYA